MLAREEDDSSPLLNRRENVMLMKSNLWSVLVPFDFYRRLRIETKSINRWEWEGRISTRIRWKGLSDKMNGKKIESESVKLCSGKRKKRVKRTIFHQIQPLLKLWKFSIGKEKKSFNFFCQYPMKKFENFSSTRAIIVVVWAIEDVQQSSVRPRINHLRNPQSSWSNVWFIFQLSSESLKASFSGSRLGRFGLQRRQAKIQFCNWVEQKNFA